MYILHEYIPICCVILLSLINFKKNIISLKTYTVVCMVGHLIIICAV
jgi:hypothetical protein